MKKNMKKIVILDIKNISTKIETQENKVSKIFPKEEKNQRWKVGETGKNIKGSNQMVPISFVKLQKESAEEKMP